MRLIALATLAVLVGCSSDGDSDGSSTDAGSDATSGTGGVGGTGGASHVDIACGANLTCTGGQKCCIPLGSDDPARCAAECTFEQEIAVSCVGTEDCQGNACCGSPLFGYECASSPSCSGSDKQLCADAVECETMKCNPQTVNGVELGVCVPP